MEYTERHQYRKGSRTLIAVITMGIMLSTPVYAVTNVSSPTAQPTSKVVTSSGNTSQLNELKQRLATKVAELRTVVKRAMYGTVKSVSVASATVETSTKEIKIELEDTVKVAQMISGKRTTLTTDDISVGDPMTVFGTYDETLDLLKAQYIFIESATVTKHISGTVTEVDTKNFSVTVNTPEGRTVVIDIEKITKSSAWNKTDGIAKSGFSKIAVGDTVHVAGAIEPKKEDHISAIRILDIGNVSGVIPTLTPTTTPTASSSATPKPTVKPTIKATATPATSPKPTP